MAQKPLDIPDTLLNLTEAVKEFEVSRSTLQRAIKSGEISYRTSKNGKQDKYLDPAVLADKYKQRGNGDTDVTDSQKPKVTHPPLRLPSRAVPRPWHEKTPETLPLTHPEWHVQTAQSRATPGCKPLQQAAVACWGSRRRGERAAAAAGGGPEAGGGKMVFGFPIRAS
jgi:hypothetical protein